eukprot:812338-Lingulodinium_polyedra.AAC.1
MASSAPGPWGKRSPRPPKQVGSIARSQCARPKSAVSNSRSEACMLQASLSTRGRAMLGGRMRAS